MINKKWLKAAFTMAFFAVVLAVYTLGSAPWGDGKAILHVAIAFAAVGALFGAVVALDSSSGMSVGNLPALRTLVCGILGAIIVVLACSALKIESVGTLWVIVGALAGATLGWLGWRWAKYFNF